MVLDKIELSQWSLCPNWSRSSRRNVESEAQPTDRNKTAFPWKYGPPRRIAHVSNARPGKCNARALIAPAVRDYRPRWRGSHLGKICTSSVHHISSVLNLCSNMFKRLIVLVIHLCVGHQLKCFEHLSLNLIEASEWRISFELAKWIPDWIGKLNPRSRVSLSN